MNSTSWNENKPISPLPPNIDSSSMVNRNNMNTVSYNSMPWSDRFTKLATAVHTSDVKHNGRLSSI